MLAGSRIAGLYLEAHERFPKTPSTAAASPASTIVDGSGTVLPLNWTIAAAPEPGAAGKVSIVVVVSELRRIVATVPFG